MQKIIKNNFGNIFKIIIEKRQIAVRLQNLATESFKEPVRSPASKVTFAHISTTATILKCSAANSEYKLMNAKEIDLPKKIRKI